MKHIRNILLFIAILFGLVMQAEVYQNMLWNFNGAYYLSSQYLLNEDDVNSFISDSQTISAKHNVHIFVAYNQRTSNYQTTLYIYGDDSVICDDLKRTIDIEEKAYTALISGITTVKFENFSKLANIGNEQNVLISYIGDEENIIATYQGLAQNYALTQPAYWQSKETDMMFIVWGLIASLMLVLNVVEVIRRQKEVVVRASLGESTGIIAVKSVAIDILSYVALFILAKLLVSNYISGFYEDRLILAVYCVGAIVSLIPYTAFNHFDVRKAFANVPEKKGMFYLLSGLKVVAAAITIFTITTNLSSIHGNLLTSTTLLDAHKDGYYFKVMSNGVPFEDGNDDTESTEEKFWEELYKNEYDTLNPTICIGSQIGDMGDYIFVNHNAKDMLQGFSKKLSETDMQADVLVFVPQGKKVEGYKETAREEIERLFQNANSLQISYQEYSGSEKFYYLNSNREEAVDGLTKVNNPVIVYQVNANVTLNGSYIEMGTYNGAVIYNNSESTIRRTAEMYASQLGSYYFVLTNVAEDYTYSHGFLVKLISFISSLCVLVLLLDIAVVISEVKMEFRLRSMEIALKKVLGYSFYERYKRFIVSNFVENLIAVLGVFSASFFISNANPAIALLIGAIVTVIEMAIIFVNVMWLERTNISKSLKGGCL